jgi:hypothetical protein
MYTHSNILKIKIERLFMIEYEKGWIMGFIEGEGCFHIGFAVAKSNNLGYQLIPRFELKQIRINRPVLERIKNLLDVGTVYDVSLQYQRNNGIRASNQSTFVIKGLNQCEKFVLFLEQQIWFTTKRDDYLLWCEAIKLFKKKEHLNKKGILAICEIRDKMNVKRKPKNYRFLHDVKRLLGNV